MSKKHKIPTKEATGKKNLSGSYLISFRLSDISDKDNIIISDIIEGLARTFEESKGLSKISHLDIEKTDKTGTPLSEKPLKIGDYVKLNQKVVITAAISEENGTYIAGSKLSSNIVGEVEIALSEDSQALINNMKDSEDEIELIDFDSPAEAIITDEYGEETRVTVNIDSVKVKKDYLDKIGE